MDADRPARIDPWRLEIVVVKASTHSSGERSAVRRDTMRGLLLHLGPGMYVDRVAFQSLTPEEQHIVRMRAVTAAADRPVTFSHWSTAVLHGLPVLWPRLERVHVTVDHAGSRSGSGAAWHVFPLSPDEVVLLEGLRATAIARTVVDVAGGSPFEEGVMAADGALRIGVPRADLLAAAARANPRRASARIADVIAFAHPGAESAAESRFRVTAFRLRVAPPELQRRFVLSTGAVVFLDAYLAEADAGVEIDGVRKYLDPAIAKRGVERALLDEERRGDELRILLRRLARVGWQQAGSPALLGTVLRRIGVTAPRVGITLADYAAAAARAQPRFLPRPLGAGGRRAA